ncbi:MAG: GntR family transcriptional regulator [Clostridia bacterium]|nr:GntR family transcriptional regulator [Clostridia bacterium]
MDYQAIAEQLGPRTGATQEWVCKVLRQGIVRGDIPGGTQLKQDEISAALNVSHIPVREALRQLEAHGLVTIYANRGAVVSTLTRSQLLDMMEVRATLSVTKLRNSAPHLTAEDYAELEDIVRKQKETTETFETERLNYRFHEILGSHDDNAVANTFMNLIHDNIDRYLRHDFYDYAEHRAVSVGEHEAILEACKAGDYDKACSILHDHIIAAKDYISKDIV